MNTRQAVFSAILIIIKSFYDTSQALWSLSTSFCKTCTSLSETKISSNRLTTSRMHLQAYYSQCRSQSTATAAITGSKDFFLQTINRVVRPIAYFSQSLSKANRNNAMTQKVMLGLVNLLRHFRYN